MRTQCKLLGVSRSTASYKPVAEPSEDVRLKHKLDRIYTQDPCLGSRRLVTILQRDHGLMANRKRLQRLRREMGLETIYCRPRTSKPGAGHEVVPYLLRTLVIDRPNHVWCADITYVPLPRGHAYLCAVMDWFSRRVLGWAVSNTMDVALCLEAYRMAKQTAGCTPEIFNTDQGSQFTSATWLGTLRADSIAVSMDGKGRWMDNVFIERLWRSIKYEDLYLRQYADVRELELGVAHWMKRYNRWRPHQALGNRTPEDVHLRGGSPEAPILKAKEVSPAQAA
jgi:putative transposase